MIKLQEIKKSKNKITCTAFIEDCKEKINISLDVANKELLDIELPKDYEWCKKHIYYAKQYLISLIDNVPIPEQKIIMWY